MKDIKDSTRFSEDKQKLLVYMLEEEKIELTGVTSITLRDNPEESPLSFAQERLWFLDQFIPQNAAYNIPIALRIKGLLKIAVLEQSLNEILRRHQTLRTKFMAEEGQPIQIAFPEFNLPIHYVNFENFVEDQRQSLTLQLAVEEAQKPFDLRQDSLVRAQLLCQSAEEHVLLLTMHHAIADGWSLGVLVRELAALYEAFSTGKPSPLPVLPIQYGDFAVWQRQRLQGEVLETQLDYWKQKLGGSLPVLDLPTDRPRPAMQTFRGAKRALNFSKPLLENLKSLSQQQGVTLFMTLLTAFKVLLYRYTGQEDILIGSPVAGRNQIETENLIGLFVNLLVLRTDLSGNPTFQDCLERVREVVLEAYNHQEVPFEKLVEILKPDRDLSYSPLFQVMFALQNTPMPLLEFSGQTLSPLAVENGTAKFDLTLDLSETSDGIYGFIEYNTDLFDAETIDRMVGHLQMLLEGIVDKPDRQLSQLPLLTTDEQQQLLVEWNNTQTDFPRDKCIHQLFEEQVKRTPNAVAVVFENEELTYLALNERANQLAHYLQRLGVGPEVVVGVCLERSLEMVVGLLGILKAGGAYLPLDPAYPPERLAFMLQDAQVPVLITQQKQIAHLPHHKAQVLCFDTDREKIDREVSKNLANPVLVNQKAYLLYTSGSTGQPKGVVIEHQNTVALIDWASKTFTAQELSGVLACTSICFDLSVFELFVPLCGGGKVILVANPLHLSTTAAFQEVTLINTVPSVIAELLRGNSIPAFVLTINLAGESLPKELVGQLYQKTNIKRVFNLYGPSEDTTYSTFSGIKSEDSIVTIGRPIDNTQVYVLDAHLQPVPSGVRGELHIAGEGLARGYLNRPELTAEKFIDNPFKNSKFKRLYKTGDLVRYLPDGNLQYLGRLDDQVKIRGFRIELGEIEAVMSQHQGVSKAVVVAQRDADNGQRLIAYAVPKPETHLSVNKLRLHLKQHLPDFMIPSAFFILDALPLTPNGKLDRRALGESNIASSVRETVYVEPQTKTEVKLAEIWRQILGIDQIGIHDNFFELGGHSLLAMRVIHQVHIVFEMELPLRSLFEEPTIVGLSKVIDYNPGQNEDLNRSKIQARPRQKTDLTKLVSDFKQLSDEEVKNMLQEKMVNKI